MKLRHDPASMIAKIRNRPYFRDTEDMYSLSVSMVLIMCTSIAMKASVADSTSIQMIVMFDSLSWREREEPYLRSYCGPKSVTISYLLLYQGPALP